MLHSSAWRACSSQCSAHSLSESPRRTFLQGNNAHSIPLQAPGRGSCYMNCLTSSFMIRQSPHPEPCQPANKGADTTRLRILRSIYYPSFRLHYKQGSTASFLFPSVSNSFCLPCFPRGHIALLLKCDSLRGVSSCSFSWRNIRLPSTPSTSTPSLPQDPQPIPACGACQPRLKLHCPPSVQSSICSTADVLSCSAYLR